MKRFKIEIRGVVQGVGFRPYVYRLARRFNLAGKVFNDPNGVVAEIEGTDDLLQSFIERLPQETPPLAEITDIIISDILPNGDRDFVIASSIGEQSEKSLISPDVAVCEDCLAEMFDPDNRRAGYPFINCTNCGPRYTIISGAPYDRSRTSMASFKMCPACLAEYQDPGDRRFHAQPNACPVCGPRVTLYCPTGSETSSDPIAEAIARLRRGEIGAIKGIGGFHLAADPANAGAVERLRLAKGRSDKPFALMAADLETIRSYCRVNDFEADLLRDPRRPIVLLDKTTDAPWAENIAPGLDRLGFMLPYAPLHHLILKSGPPVLIMTSANFSEEPIAIDNAEATERLSQMADFFLFHDRPILQRCDDSIVYDRGNSLRFTRRSRSWAPHPISLKKPFARNLLAVGGQLKNTIAFSRGHDAFISQHIGELDNPHAYDFFREASKLLADILRVEPEAIVCDMHPEYFSSQWATEFGKPIIEVQHHHAHMAATLGETGFAGPAIGIILDGAGHGPDGTIWGGEVLVGDATGFERFAWLDPTPLPGGEMAVRQPWRMALAYLRAAYGKNLPENLPMLHKIDDESKTIVEQMIDRRLNSPLTSSCGRLFDGAAAIIGFGAEITYEAQAAIALETAARRGSAKPEQLPVGGGGPIDYRPMIRRLATMAASGKNRNDAAAYFHHALVEIFVAASRGARDQFSVETVVLSGGVFQNRIIEELLEQRLESFGFEVLTPKRLPSSDGGLSFGQLVVADAQIRTGKYKID